MKEIHTSRDLAINGATPAFEDPVHVGQPNIGDREIFLGYIEQILSSKWVTNNGPLVRELEERLARFLGVKHCVTMCNGTVALEIAIRALELDGEVIVPSYTFIATAHALWWQRVTPVFADIDPATHCLDLRSVEAKITPRTQAILAVHLWGTPCDVEGLNGLAKKHDLALLFDAAHAFGNSHANIQIGNFGQCEIFSFHATKFFNTFEGGAITTNDDELAERFRLMRNFGFSGPDNVIYPGTNGKMTEVSAAMGLTNLGGVEKVVNSNKSIYQSYQSAINKIPGLSLYAFAEEEERNYQYIVVEVADDYPCTRDEIVRILQAEGVLARRYFWPGCHRMEPFRSMWPTSRDELPNTERVAGRVIVLPTGPNLPPGGVEFISGLLAAIGKRAAEIQPA